VNAIGTEQPFGRVRISRELGEGPTQTGGTSLRPEVLEEPGVEKETK